MPYPLRFTPLVKTLVWGSETWMLSGVEGSLSIVADGPDKGRTIADLTAEHRGRLVGEHVYARTGDRFPLLIKFIDARQDLSVQVHPDDALAAARHRSCGKTEMWYVMDADPGAALLSGFRRPVTPEEYDRLVAGDRITDVLGRYEVRPGDVFYLPAGRIHAIGGGIRLAEIQQTSDITYRIYDYGRPGLDGRPRPLHTAEARAAIDFGSSGDCRTRYASVRDGGTVLVDCPWFTTSLYDLHAPCSRSLEGRDSFTVVLCLAGGGTLTDAEPSGAYTAPLRAGECLLIPATSTGVSFFPQGHMQLLTSYIS